MLAAHRGLGKAGEGEKERNETKIFFLTQESLHKVLPPDPEFRVTAGDRTLQAGTQLCFAVLSVLTVAQGTGDSRVHKGGGGPR